MSTSRTCVSNHGNGSRSALSPLSSRQKSYFEDGKPENRRCKTDGLNCMFGRNGGVPLVRLHGVPQAIRFGTGTAVWFTAATPSTRSLLKKAPIAGGGSEICPGRDATKPDGHLTWGNRTMADHSCWRLWNWINDDELKRQHHPVTQPVPSWVVFPQPEYHPCIAPYGSGTKKSQGWYDSNTEWENRHWEWTERGVYMKDLKDHLLCSVLFNAVWSDAPLLGGGLEDQAS